jgi:hypothetical protein
MSIFYVLKIYMPDGVKKAIAEHAGEEAAKMIVTGVAFEVTEARPLVAMG